MLLLTGKPQGKYHSKDIWEHTLKVVEGAPRRARGALGARCCTTSPSRRRAPRTRARSTSCSTPSWAPRCSTASATGCASGARSGKRVRFLIYGPPAAEPLPEELERQRGPASRRGRRGLPRRICWPLQGRHHLVESQPRGGGRFANVTALGDRIEGLRQAAGARAEAAAGPGEPHLREARCAARARRWACCAIRCSRPSARGRCRAASRRRCTSST